MRLTYAAIFMACFHIVAVPTDNIMLTIMYFITCGTIGAEIERQAAPQEM